MKYTDTEAYQKEVAEQFAKRNLRLKPGEVVSILKKLDFTILESELVEAEAGNMNVTFLTPEYVIKINNNPGIVKYIANVIVSKYLPLERVVQTVLHDVFQKTKCEVLVMKRAEGAMWLHAMPRMSEAENIALFSQVLDVALLCSKIEYSKHFGGISEIYKEPAFGFETFSEYLDWRLTTYCTKLREQDDIDLPALSKIEVYVRKHLSLFQNDTPCFVHNDLHAGNILHTDGALNAIIDFDTSESRPLYTILISLIGMIDNPSQYVDGTKYVDMYKERKFEYLYTIIKAKLPEIFDDKNLGLKLNILGILEGLFWAGDSWSKEWTKEMIEGLSTQEIPVGDDYSKTYYVPIIEKILKS